MSSWRAAPSRVHRTRFNNAAPDGAGQMMTAHAPVEAGVRQATALQAKVFDVDAYLIEKLLASAE